MPALAVKNISHFFGKFCALDNISFEIQEGDFTVLLGLNGAGKTTLYSLITRLYSFVSGSIEIYNYNLKEKPTDALKNIGVVFQQPTLDLDLSVKENLEYHSSLHGMTKITSKKRIKSELERIGMQQQINSKIRSLSGGQRRRVEIARSLLHNPKLLLLDEPTVGLDIDSRQNIIRHVKNLCKNSKLAVLWATHLIDEIDRGEKVIIINKGKILIKGDSEDVIKRAKVKNIKDAFNKLVGIKK
tara:strand:- start:6941 stop:7669 length:729 start_codon:yes stop_codon:yes gene_type:complete